MGEATFASRPAQGSACSCATRCACCHWPCSECSHLCRQGLCCGLQRGLCHLYAVVSFFAGPVGRRRCGGVLWCSLRAPTPHPGCGWCVGSLFNCLQCLCCGHLHHASVCLRR